jgi:hypothetical protein
MALVKQGSQALVAGSIAGAGADANRMVGVADVVVGAKLGFRDVAWAIVAGADAVASVICGAELVGGRVAVVVSVATVVGMVVVVVVVGEYTVVVVVVVVVVGEATSTVV